MQWFGKSKWTVTKFHFHVCAYPLWVTHGTDHTPMYIPPQNNRRNRETPIIFLTIIVAPKSLIVTCRLPSPLLFILALEPWAYAIRQDKDISGVLINDHGFKLNMCEDDILLTLSKPSHPIPRVLEIIDIFGSLSGYWSKSEAKPLNINTHLADLGPASFGNQKAWNIWEWKSHHLLIKYLN